MLRRPGSFASIQQTLGTIAATDLCFDEVKNAYAHTSRTGNTQAIYCNALHEWVLIKTYGILYNSKWTYKAINGTDLREDGEVAVSQ